MVNTILSNHGYKIKKNELKLSDIKELKKNLIVNPFTYNDFGEKNQKSFSLYLESPNSFYIPRFYGYDKYGDPKINKIHEGNNISIPFVLILIDGK